MDRDEEASGELVRVAAEWTHLANDCGRRAAAWGEQGGWWSQAGHGHLATAGERVRLLAEHAREMATRLREGAREVLDAVPRA
jgi:hypothetical protein